MSRFRPLAILGVALVIGAFLGQAGVLVALAGMIVATIVWRRERARYDQMLLADYIETRAFPSDTIEEFAQSQTGAVTLDDARARMKAWRDGYLAAEWDQRVRRSNAGKRGAATRRRRR